MNIILGILESLVAAIILSYILKIIYNRNIKQFLGEYYEITQDGKPLYKYHYTVTKLGNTLSPFSRYTLKIVRTCDEDDSSWIGEYY